MRRLIAAGIAAAVAIGAKFGLDKLRGHGSPTRPGKKATGPAADLGRRGRHVAGQVKGLTYRTLRRHPNADVDDATLADRIRSSLGPLEKRLQVPRVHVTVENGVAILHGDIPDTDAATQVARATEGIPGVREVRSHLGPPKA
jgi:hypothetical protein